MKEPRAWRRRSLLVLLLVASFLPVGVMSAAASAVMEVVPDFSIVSPFSGPAGAAQFAPTSVTYTVTNRGIDEPLSWCATKSQPWVIVVPACGMLEPGASADVTVTVDQTVAATLAADGYSDPIVFTNLTNQEVLTQDGAVAEGFTRRYVTLNVLGTATSPVQGFGATTRGGANGTVFHVTTLDDNGDDLHPVPGSLRDAVSQSNRYIVFDVAGTIVLRTFLYVQAHHVTIDGVSAPAPGIEITQYSLILRGNRGAHDVIVRGLRVRDIVRSPTADTQWDGIQIANGAFNILIDHVSLHGADDGSIDITTGAHDVTVSFCLIGPPKSGKNSLVKYNASRITFHHNLFLDSTVRNPQVENDDAGTLATTITADVRNNVMWGFGAGTRVAKGARANVMGNYYSQASSAIVVASPGRAFVSGNVVHGTLVDVNQVGTEAAPFPAATVDTTDAVRAACEVHGNAGALPRDAFDRELLAALESAGIPDGPCVLVTVTKAGGGSGTTVSTPRAIDCGTGCSALVVEGTTLTLTATAASGSAFLGFSRACAGGHVSASVDVTCVATFERKPDLVVSALTGPAGAEPGGFIAIRHTTQNRAGTGPAGPSVTRLYLSKNTTITADDVLLAWADVGPLAPGQSSVLTSDVLVPPGTPAGIHYVVAKADGAGALEETYETDNTRSYRIVIGADLSVPSLTAPSAAARGSSIVVTVVTANATVVGPAPPSVTRLYLSRDTVPVPAEMIAEHVVSRLATGARETWHPTITVPASLATGTYYLIARADDDGEVVETRETNNGRVRAITIR